jgi:hypothetical protein
MVVVMAEPGNWPQSMTTLPGQTILLAFLVRCINTFPAAIDANGKHSSALVNNPPAAIPRIDNGLFLFRIMR